MAKFHHMQVMRTVLNSKGNNCMLYRIAAYQGLPEKLFSAIENESDFGTISDLLK